MAHISSHSDSTQLVNSDAMVGSGISEQDTNPRETGGLWYNIAGIAVLIALMGIGLAYLIDAIGKQEPDAHVLTTAGPTINKIVAGQKLAIPPAWFRYNEQRADGFSDQVDLQFALPLGLNERVVETAVRFVPNSRARPSARLLDAVYLHQFTPDQVEGPPGLIGKPLKAIDGFQAETVWYDPLATNPFVAKCMAPVIATGKTSCIRTVQLSEFVSAIYVFEVEALTNWKKFDTEADKWLARIGGLVKPN